jgi:hypothetical protein
MTYKPQKPAIKKSTTTEVWSETADGRLDVIEKQVENLEKRLAGIVNRLKKKDSGDSTGYSYSITRKK